MGEVIQEDSQMEENMDSGLSETSSPIIIEDERLASRKRFYVADDDDTLVGIVSQFGGDNKRLKSEVDESDFGEDFQDFGEEIDSIEVGDLSETVCCICDNGGDVICCDGPCMRSFHLNKGAGGASDSNCSTLGFSKAEAERMDKFFCPNCKSKKHQCYICGGLGCSDEAASAAQEVFVCDSAMCGHFYHPDCVARMILKNKDKAEQDGLVESIKEGKGFLCPLHKCWKCGKGEVEGDQELQFGVCRRCPRVWHRKCFPEYLLFEEEDDEPQRAWEGLLPDRILIYCMRHKIIRNLATPARTHVKFPEGCMPSEKKPLGMKRLEMEGRKRRLIKLHLKKKKYELDCQTENRMPGLKAAKKLSEFNTMRKVQPAVSQSMKAKSGLDGSVSRTIKIKKNEQLSDAILINGRKSVEESFKKERIASMDKQMCNPHDGAILIKDKRGVSGFLKQERSMAIEQKSDKLSAMPQLHRKMKPPLVKSILLDGGTRSMVDTLIEKTKRFVTFESVREKHDMPLCYRRYSKNPDKKYSLVKIESIIKGMRKAVETLDNGGSIEDAQAKCSSGFIRFLKGCKKELKVYLAPFLHGARYTSFGRHFTKTEKLEEIVDRLHWYVQGGDMIVDFCCGANEFSSLMKKKLDRAGKQCDYKNFDIIQTKDDFNFVKKDWFQVKQDELVEGSRLIMGLNPPFGVKGQLANSFIDHALKFRPKLIVLIVPKETERLDQKNSHYDLIWEDLDLLKGQSFYLPGSVDVNEKSLSDWNTVAPPLFVWSRPDWTGKHRQIALEKGHTSQDFPFGLTRFAGLHWKTKLPVDGKRSYTVHVEPRFAEERNNVEGTHTKESIPKSMGIKDMSEKILMSKDCHIGRVDNAKQNSWKNQSPGKRRQNSDSRHESSSQGGKSAEKFEGSLNREPGELLLNTSQQGPMDDLNRHGFFIRDVKIDSFRDYNSLLKGPNTDKGYQASTHRAGSPGSRSGHRHNPSDFRRSWNAHDTYKRDETASDYLRKDSPDTSFQRKASIYNDNAAHTRHPYEFLGIHRNKYYPDPEPEQTGAFRTHDFEGCHVQPAGQLSEIARHPKGVDIHAAEFAHMNHPHEILGVHRNKYYPDPEPEPEPPGAVKTHNFEGRDLQPAGHLSGAGFARQPMGMDIHSTEFYRGNQGPPGREYMGHTAVNPAIDRYGRYLLQGTTNSGANRAHNARAEKSFLNSHFPERENFETCMPLVNGSLEHQQVTNEPHIFDNRVDQAYRKFSKYPTQRSFTGQSKSEFSGGWYED